MLKPSRQPYGFKNLLAYKKAEELQMECSRITAQFPKYKTLIALADQMDRSARSAKQNIVEGWKRNSTKEYYDFLGFSIGANTELEEDCNDIWKGTYRDLMGIKGVMGEMGSMRNNIEKGEKGIGGEIGGERGIMGVKGEMGIPTTPTPTTPITHFVPLNPLKSLNPSSLSDLLNPFDIEKIPFYPLNKNLPLVVQLKLRCKELNYLLHQLQKSLENKMNQEKTLTAKDLAQNRSKEIRNEQKWEV